MSDDCPGTPPENKDCASAVSGSPKIFLVRPDFSPLSEGQPCVQSPSEATWLLPEGSDGDEGRRLLAPCLSSMLTRQRARRSAPASFTTPYFSL